MTRPALRVYEMKDNKLQMVGYINDTKSIIWKRQWSTYGDFEIHLTKPNSLLKNGRFVLLNGDVNKFGIVTRVVDDSDGRQYNSTQDFTVYGYEASWLLSKRVTVPSTDDNTNHDGYHLYNSKSAGYIMTDLVNVHCISPTDTARKMPFLSVETWTDNGDKTITFKTRYKTLTRDFETISQYTGYGYRIVPDLDAGKLVFKVLKGVDRTQHIETIQDGVVTGASINPNAYIFSQDNRRVKKHTYTHDSSAYKNFAYVAGEGDGAARKIVQIDGGTTGLDRAEVFIDARDIQSGHTTTKVTDGTISSDDESTTTTTTSGDTTLTEEQLKERGREKLQTDYRDVTSYEYESDPTDYGKYYDLGDTVTYIDKKNGVTMDQQITAVEETYEDGTLSLSITFGYTESTISSQVEAASNAQLVERTGISREFDKIQANFVSTADMLAKHAYILGLDVDDATVKRLKAEIANFDSLTAQRATVQALTATNATIDKAWITSAMITSLTADKITGGEIDTDKIDIKSEDGTFKISGSTLTISDKSGNVRVQLGLDSDGNYDLKIYKSDGSGVLLDGNGITDIAIPDGTITNKHISAKAKLCGAKMDIDSVVTEANDNATTRLNAEKVAVTYNGASATAQTAVDNTTTTLKALQTSTENNANAVGKMKKYIDFDDSEGLSIGGASGAKTVISDTDIEFKDANGNTVGTVGSDISIEDLAVKNTIKIGGFSLTPHDDGSVSFNWTGTA